MNTPIRNLLTHDEYELLSFFRQHYSVFDQDVYPKYDPSHPKFELLINQPAIPVGGKRLSTIINPDGSLSCTTSKLFNGVRVQIPINFIMYSLSSGKIPSCDFIRHKNGDINDMRFSNLELVNESMVVEKMNKSKKLKPVEVIVNPAPTYGNEEVLEIINICKNMLDRIEKLISTDSSTKTQVQIKPYVATKKSKKALILDTFGFDELDMGD